MLSYAARRIGLSALVAFGVVVLTFVIARVVPGDPAAGWAGPRAGPAERDRVRAELGLDLPLPQQIGGYLGGVLRGDWGISVRTHRPVLDDLLALLPNTLQLVLAGLLIGLLVGVPAGLVAARWAHRSPDLLVRTGAVLGGSVPVFWLALLMQMFFATRMGLLPVAGSYDPAVLAANPLVRITGMPLLDALLTGNLPMAASVFDHLVLPALVVAAYPVAVITRLVRAGVLDTLGETHVQMTRALGFPERTVLARFALRPNWNPVLQTCALIFGYSLVNSFLVEAIFAYPGLGGYAAASADVVDLPAIVGVTLLVALLYIAANLLVDLLQAALDPRMGLR
ncbi:ABC transporter permease [Nocardiopsis ansamitocini]|uniref:Peptide ABC transporter permease n=1 Tax=Nocardiopsis ansamitocini TaxID=1670832 RepID=A0A9W6PAX1_9ACTN|nr:ABC transporter permease [Nocardiopsis ansamitocini]GLU50321.1 peptide ABC transporter permease [Nocardiopsis ansamitocini]